MADQEQPELELPNAPFPAPPPFWKHFTPSNLSRLQALKADPAYTPSALPPDLQLLIPPTPPTETYTIFGEEYVLSADLPALSSRGVTQLYPAPSPTSPPLDHSAYLLRVVRSLHLNFAELSILLSRNPTLKDPKLADVKTLFQNAHWLINMYRPHQARESLIQMMEEEVAEAEREIEESERLRVRVEEVLKGVEEEGVKAAGEAEKIKESREIVAAERNGEGRASIEQQSRDQDTKRLWKMMQDIDIGPD